MEYFASEWREEVHVKPLAAFMANEFSMELSSYCNAASFLEELPQ